MKQDTSSPKFIRQRKFFTVLPLLTLPFVTLLFWAIGGGKVHKTTAAPQGFNFNLPGAYLEEDKTPLDKLGFYQKAERDSLRMAELMKNDPYYQGGSEIVKQPGESKLLGLATKPPGSGLNASPYSKGPMDTTEALVYKKLDQLTTSLNASAQVPQHLKQDELSLPPAGQSVKVSSEDVDRLENLLRGSGGEDLRGGDLRGGDPEMKELSGMLEKILDIQHPERVQQRLRQTSQLNKGQVFAVSAEKQQTPITSLSSENTSQLKNRFETSIQNGFYSLDDAPLENSGQNAIEAVIHETQQLVSGSTVKLRLVNDVLINGLLIPKDNFVYGIASLDGERLVVTVSSLRYQNSLFPVALSIFDMDGLKGIHIPGAISRDAVKQSGERAIQSIGMSTFDNSVGAQAASAGIELGRNFLSKKVKLIKVTVKAGYQVLLRDDKQDQ